MHIHKARRWLGQPHLSFLPLGSPNPSQSCKPHISPRLWTFTQGPSEQEGLATVPNDLTGWGSRVHDCASEGVFPTALGKQATVNQVTIWHWLIYPCKSFTFWSQQGTHRPIHGQFSVVTLGKLNPLAQLGGMQGACRSRGTPLGQTRSCISVGTKCYLPEMRDRDRKSPNSGNFSPSLLTLFFHTPSLLEPSSSSFRGNVCRNAAAPW